MRRLSTATLLATLSLAGASAARAQDNEHWLPPVWARTSVNSVEEHRLVLSTNRATAFDVTVARGDGTVIFTQSIAAGAPAILNIGGKSPATAYENILVGAAALNTVNTSAGLVLNAPFPFFAEVRHLSSAQAGSIFSKGRLALGTEFRTGHLIGGSGGVNDEKGHFISFMATEDGTVVKVTDIKPGAVFLNTTSAGTPATSIPISVTLDRGESYVLGHHVDVAAGSDDFNGTRVTSSKPIAVTCGSWLNGNNSGGGRDIGCDQTVPVPLLENDWVLMRGLVTSQQAALERPCVVAAHDGTQVFVNGGAIPLATLDAGDYFFVPFASYDANGAMYVVTSEPAYLYQNTANVVNGMAMGLACWTPCASSARVEIAQGDFWTPGVAPRLRIVADTAATFTVNGAAPPSPLAVPGTADWVLYDVVGVTGTNVVLSTSNKALVVTLVAGSGNRGVLGTYTGFGNAPLVISPFNVPGSNIAYPVTLTLEQATGFTSFEWFRDGVSVQSGPLATFDAPGPGTYTVVGTGHCGRSPSSYAVVLPAAVDVEVEATGITKINDTQYDVTYRLSLENRTGATITDVDLRDDLQAALAPMVPGTHWSLQSVVASEAFAAGESNASYDGRTGGVTALLDPAVDLADDEEGVVTIVVRVTITGGIPAGSNTVTVSALPGPVTDSDSTPFPPLSVLDVLVQAGTPVAVGGGVWDVPYTVSVKNQGNVIQEGVQLFQDLEAAFAPRGLADWALQAGPTGGGAFVAADLNTAYTGEVAGDRNLLVAGAELAPGETGTVTFTVRIDIDAGPPTASLTVSGSAGFGVGDVSDDVVGPGNLSIDGPDADLDPTNDPTPFAVDTDGDGVRDALDLDDDDDGIPDTTEEGGVAGRDTDGDGLPDRMDLDSDSDGIPDLWESGLSAAQLTALDAGLDGDLDAAVGTNGLADALETTPDSGTVNYALANTDGLTRPDFQDLDADQDGVPDVSEVGGGAVDSNGDARVDGFASDADQDGLADAVDPSHDGPAAPFVAAPAPGTAVVLTNSDGVTTPLLPDYRDLDADDDGIADLLEAANAAATDANADGIVDGADADQDGLADAIDGDDAAFGSPGAAIPAALASSGGSPLRDFQTRDRDGGASDRADYGLRAGPGTPDANADGQVDVGADVDQDGIIDAVDRDAAARGFPESADFDGDGVVNTVDLDDDGDGIPDTIEQGGVATRDTDGDGQYDHVDRDSDSDGIPDLWESGLTAAQLTALDTDLDGDVDAAVGTNGLADALETTPDSGTINYALANTDGLARPDFQDLDADQDGVPDVAEVSGTADADGDALLDGASSDADGDGLADSVDPTHDGPLSFTTAPTPGVGVGLLNSDGDPLPIPDFRDLDADDDGVADLLEAQTGAADANGDGLVDGPDADQDGLADAIDGDDATFGSPGTAIPAPAVTAGGSSAPDLQTRDSDGGASDRVDHGLPAGPGTPDANSDGKVDDGADADRDGIIDLADRDTTTFGFPESLDADGDGIADKTDLDDDNDGIPDLVEQDGLATRDTDGDGVLDHLDRDADQDGIPDLVESGLSAAQIASLDADGDGDIDGAVGTNGLADAVEVAPDGGALNYTVANTDALGRPDFQDRDADSDGITDALEAGGADADGDGVLDGSQADADGDGLLDSVDRKHDGPLASLNADPGPGTALPLPDTDGDGRRDHRDLDSDDDGIPDVTEARGADADGDALLDGAASDGDGDGLADAVDGTPLALPDTDADGRRDFRDLDSDNDGLSDLRESGNPSATDADGDGVVDGPDGDGDGLRDAVDGDDVGFGSGGAGVPAPANAAGGTGEEDYRAVDRDGDGTPDRGAAGLPSGPGTPDADGDGVIDDPTDGDGDGIPDSVDLIPGTFGGPESAARFSFLQPSFVTHEEVGLATITIVRRGDPSAVVTLGFATEDDEATAPSDYTATSGTRTFLANQTTATFTVAITDDALLEAPEALRLRLFRIATSSVDVDVAALVITAEPAIAITTLALPAAQQGAPYSTPIDLDDGGLGPTFTWTVSAGALPPGLTLSGTGRAATLGGTPAQSGTFPFTLRASDDGLAGVSDTQDYTLVVDVAAPGVAPEIDAVGVVPGQVGQRFSRSFTARGGATPCTWSVLSGALPPGLSLNPFTGALAGTPTTAGGSPFTFTVQVTDAGGAVDATGPGEEVTVTITPSPVQIVTFGLDDGLVGAPYSARVDAAGGVGPTYTWSVSAGALPPGLSLIDLDPSARLAGTPSAAGTFSFSLRLADDQQPGVSDDQTYLVRIDPPAGTPRITTPSLPDGTVNRSYQATVSAVDGQPPYVFDLTSGALPPGLSLTAATGGLSGAPTVDGATTIEVRATDALGGTHRRIFGIVIAAPPVIVTDSAPPGVQGAGYHLPLLGAHGVTPYEWALVSGVVSGDSWTGGGLPAGLALSANSGVIAGVPSAAPGSYPITVRLTDRNGAIDTQNLTIVILAPPGATPLVLSDGVPRGAVGGAYSAPLVAAGGTGPYVWSVTVGSLPAWATLDPATGVVYGVPAVAGSTVFQVQVVDRLAASSPASAVLTLEVLGPLALAPASLPVGFTGTPYTQGVTATGGANGYAYALTGGTLPLGLAFNGQTGAFSGTTVVVGSFPLIVQATDAEGATVTRPYTLVVQAPTPPPTPPTLSGTFPAGAVGVVYSAAPTTTGGQAPFTYGVVSGSLPDGLMLDATHGRVTGVPTRAGSFGFTLEVTDSVGAGGDAPFTVVVGGGAAPAARGNRVQGSGNCALRRAAGPTDGAESLALLALLLVEVLRRRRETRLTRA